MDGHVYNWSLGCPTPGSAYSQPELKPIQMCRWSIRTEFGLVDTSCAHLQRKAQFTLMNKQGLKESIVLMAHQDYL